jgi:hypothetical protein
VPGQQRLLTPLRRAAARNAGIGALVDSHEIFHAVAWTAAEAYVLLRATPDLQASGIRVHVPDWWHRATPRAQIRAELGGDAPASLGLEALLDFKVGWFIGDESLTEEEWRRVVQGADGLYRFRGRWTVLDPEHHAEAMRQWDSLAALTREGRVDFAERHAAARGARARGSERGARGGEHRAGAVAGADARSSCSGRRATARPTPGRRCAGACGRTSATASRGCGCSRGSGSAGASPTTWGSARRSR